MKKKNVIGHMTTSKNFSKGWFRKLNLLPRFVCLLLAVVIWLLVVALVDPGKDEAPEDPDLPITEYVGE